MTEWVTKSRGVTATHTFFHSEGIMGEKEKKEEETER